MRSKNTCGCLARKVLLCFQVLSDPRFFANCYLLMLLIEKEITEMNFDIDRVIEFNIFTY